MVAYGSITDVLNVWADAGVFAYVLPFLMIFAVVFGILNKTKVLGESKGVQATIALALGLLSLQFDYVSNFFSIFMPYTGIGIAVLLVAVILTGLVIDEDDKNHWVKKVFFGDDGGDRTSVLAVTGRWPFLMRNLWKVEREESLRLMEGEDRPEERR